jgi:hypothetical protein
VVGLLAVGAGIGIATHLGHAASGPLRATEQAGDIGEFGLPVRPGEVADLSAPVKNVSDRPIVLERATLITLPGQPAPRFVGARLATTLDMIGDRGWPPTEPSVALSGASVAPGATVYVYYGVAGTKPGTNYLAAGLTISYRQGGHHYQVEAWGPGVACVRIKLGSDRSCIDAGTVDREGTDKLAAQH